MTAWEKLIAIAGLVLCASLVIALFIAPGGLPEPIEFWAFVVMFVVPVPWLVSFGFALWRRRRRLHWLLWSELGVSVIIVLTFFVHAAFLYHRGGWPLATHH